MKKDNSEIVLYYAIFDNGDGSAGLHLYGTSEQLEIALSEAEENDLYDMSEGGGTITQAQIDELTR